MGSGSWSTDSYRSYSASIGREYDANTCTIKTNYTSAAQAFEQSHMHKMLDPHNVIRECCDTAEHPATVPVILALDVTGSMGATAIKLQKKLNPIMRDLYKDIKDVELMVMAIGDLAYDDAPIQMSQFESDIRIAESLDHIYFEHGGGGNSWESYTASWYMAARHTKLDVWKRGGKGLIITMGDEMLNPCLPKYGLEAATGDTLQDDVSTADLLEELKGKYDAYHICVKSGSYPNQQHNKKTFAEVLGDSNVLVSDADHIHETITQIVKAFAKKNCMLLESSGCLAEDASKNAADSKIKIDVNGDITW